LSSVLRGICHAGVLVDAGRDDQPISSGPIQRIVGVFG
jgi:hypothetical protein